MKTRIIITIIALKVLTSAPVFAQEKDPGIYFKIYGGYSLFTPGSATVYPFTSPLDINGVTGNYSSNKGTVGTGANIGFGAEKEINKLLIAGIDVNYLAGKKLTANSYFSYGLPVFSFPDVGADHNRITSTATATHSVWSIIPSMSFKVLPGTNYYIYTKVGIIVALKTKYQFSERDTIVREVQTANDGVNYTFTQKCPLQLGIQTAAGVQFKLTGRVRGFAELSANFLKANASSYHFYERESDHRDGKVYIYYDTYDKSLKNTGNANGQPTTNGNVITYNFVSNKSIDTLFPISQTINNIMLNVGITVAIR